MVCLTWNCDKQLNEEIKGVTIGNKPYPEGNSLYIDYLPPTHKRFLEQVDVLKHYIKKKIPIVVFDRFLSIKNDEAEWLRRNRVKLFEPAVCYRPYFSYLPVPFPTIHGIETLRLSTLEKTIDFGYTGTISDRIKSFEKYYVETGKNYPKLKIMYSNTKGVASEKISEYSNLNVIHNENIDLGRVKGIALLGSNIDYKIGYLSPNLFIALENYVILMLPEEHRFFHSLFPVIRKPHDIDYYITSYEYAYYGYIIDIYDNINKFFPEFKMNYTVDIIKKSLEDK